jgi:hypothetical protein
MSKVLIVAGIACATDPAPIATGPITNPTNPTTGNPQTSTVLLEEKFEDGGFTARGWYDFYNDGLTSLSTAEHAPGSSRSLEVRFLAGRTNPTPAASARRAFTETESVYLSYWVKYSTNWVGSAKPYHPHEFQFFTNEDVPFVAPAYTSLSLYVEHNYEAAGGVPVIAIQDAKNIDATRINQDLTNVTERRAVAGCNGDSDGTPSACYPSGNVYLNGKNWRGNQVAFSAAAGASYKANWHKVEVYFRLNTIKDGRGVTDGILQYWADGKLILDKRNILFRTGTHANMRFNQLLMTPYIGDGSPVAQTMWIDDLVLRTAPPT